MGSSQSSTGPTAAATTTTTAATTPVLDTRIDDNNNTNSDIHDHERKKSSKETQSKLTGVALIEYKCRRRKKLWNLCVRSHYKDKFLTGQSIDPDESDCDDLFESYKRCYMKGLLREREKQNLPPPQPGTLLHEFMEDEGLVTNVVDDGDDRNKK
jgi:hypothetical protein